MKRGSRRALLLGGLVGIIVVGVALTLLVPAISRSQESSDWAACANNVHQIGLAIEMYAEDHNGRYPESFGVLLKAGILRSPRTFLCRASRNTVPGDFPKKKLAEADPSVLNRVDAWSDYVMVKGLKHAGREDVIVVYDKVGNHGGRGRNCLCQDGHVRWLSEAGFQEHMRVQEAKLRGREPISWVRNEVWKTWDTFQQFVDILARGLIVAISLGVPLVLIIGTFVRSVRFRVSHVIVILLVFSGAVVWSGWGSAALREARFPATVSRDNTRWAGFAMIRYAWDHQERYPESLGVLVKEGYLSRAEEFGGIVIVKGLEYSEDADTIIVHEREDVHAGKGRNCCFADGHVEWLSEGEFQKHMKAQEAKLREMGENREDER